MNNKSRSRFDGLVSFLTRLNLKEDSAGDWTALFSNQGLLFALRDGLEMGGNKLLLLNGLVHSKFNEKNSISNCLRLYVGTACAWQAGTSLNELIAEFGASLVADVLHELQTGRLRNAENDETARDWLEIPLCFVRKGSSGTEEAGLAAWFRMVWLPSEPGSPHELAYLTPHQQAVDRDYGKVSWLRAEADVLRYLDSKLPALPIQGAIRWDVRLERPITTTIRCLEGNSFGLSMVLGMAQLITRCSDLVPPEWKSLGDEKELQGVLGMASVDASGKLGCVGGVYVKVQQAVQGFLRTPIHSIIASCDQMEEIRRDLRLDRSATFREITFLFATSVEDALRQLQDHLLNRDPLRRKILAYRQSQLAEWSRVYRESE